MSLINILYLGCFSDFIFAPFKSKTMQRAIFQQSSGGELQESLVGAFKIIFDASTIGSKQKIFD